MVVLSLVALAVAEDCEDTAALALEARLMMLEGRLEDADDRLQRAQRSLGCGERPRAQDLSELYLSSATRRVLDNDPIAADVAFVAAHRTDPSRWDPTLGDALRAQYDQAVSAALSTAEDTGELYIDALPRGYHSALNGVETVFPISLPSGEYLVTISDRVETRYGKIVYIPPGEIREIDYGELPPARRPVWLIGGCASAGVAGGLAAIALRQHTIISSTADLETLDRAYRVQRISGTTSYGLAVLATTSLLLHVVL
ncbi:MAG: hypothetical protein P8R54_04625 [Myxococcota bacterium]|nr:hypothetical protein [Myxococcota bacterium]